MRRPWALLLTSLVIVTGGASADDAAPKPAEVKPADAKPAEVKPPITEVGNPDDSGVMWVFNEWYSAVSPTAPRLWHGTVDFGINGTDGNSKNFRLRFAANGNRETNRATTNWTFLYSTSSANSVEVENRAIFNARQEWKLRNPEYAIYNTVQLEYDRFRAFDFRLALFAGLSRTFLKNDRTLLKGRFGAGASREFGGPNEDWTPELNLGGDFNHKIDDRQSFNSSIDIFPDVSDFSNYRAQANANYEFIIDPVRNMVFKLGMIDRYDATPEGRKANDIDYYMSLGWKY
jgi:putative salt-induced outer membrane protein YdiY